ncbi:MAG: type VI secretion system tip protein VgrG [Deltaproteobacteria bacterium]|nr:type VI secretion system tip protein VgrG [Deltaproteobacteria bacterium]
MGSVIEDVKVVLATELAHLGFSDENLAMSVRAFSVREGLDRGFEVLVTAASTDPDLDLDRVAGRGAALRLMAGIGASPRRVWSGVCRAIEQVEVDATGLSIYLLRIVPQLFRLSQRTNRRLFQHRTAVEIAVAVLEEWGLAPEVRLHGLELPRHELRVQLDETDLDFISRQLEEAGVSYWFEQGEVPPEGAPGLERMKLVLGVEPQRGLRRHEGLPVRAASEHVDAEPHARELRISRAVRSGRVSLRGHDFRASRDLQLLAEAHVEHELERRYERYRFAPGAFLSERDDGVFRGARLDDRAAVAAAKIDLEREQTGRVTVRFMTNVLDLEPGSVLSLTGHPRGELCHPEGLLVVAAEVEGEIGGAWRVAVEATPTRQPHRPQLITPRPRAHGLESAIVVGPDSGDDEIHTDEHGRVKAQFHWDRDGRFDDRASCWLRVSQAWAGSGHGFVALPRVGSEVLVGFFEGDPDRPLVVGRAHNRVDAAPYALPEHRSKSVWRSRSTPGGEGYNELSFEDRAGEELVHVRAQRDLELVAMRDERTTVGANRTTSVRRSDRQHVGGSQSVEVRGDQAVRVGGRRTEVVEGGMESRAGARTGITVEDGKIVISNGQASIVLDGPIVRIDSASNIWLRSNRLVAIASKTVTIDKSVSIDQHDAVPPDVAQLPAPPAPSALPSAEASIVPGSSANPSPQGQGGKPPGGIADAKLDTMKVYEDLLAKAGVKVKLPKNLPLPPAVNEQLQHYARVIHKADVVQGQLLDPATYEAMKGLFRSRLEAEKARLVRIGDATRSNFEKNRDHLSDLKATLGDRLDLEKANLAKLRGDLGDIFSGKHGNFIESCKALVEVVKEQRAHIMALREDVIALIDSEKKWLEDTVGEWKAVGAEIQGALDDMKALVENPKDALLDLALGSDRQLGKDIASLADEFGMGEEVAALFGFDAPGGVSGGGAVGVIGATPGTVVALPKGNPAITGAPSLGAILGGGKTQLASAGLASTASPLASTSAITALGASPTVSASPTIVSRAGGLAGKDLLTAAGPGQVGFLQGPFEGQRMIVATESALPLDADAVSRHLVEAQLQGTPNGQAMNQILEAQGYVVYERSWGDFAGPFVQAPSQAGA